MVYCPVPEQSPPLFDRIAQATQAQAALSEISETKSLSPSQATVHTPDAIAQDLTELDIHLVPCSVGLGVKGLGFGCQIAVYGNQYHNLLCLLSSHSDYQLPWFCPPTMFALPLCVPSHVLHCSSDMPELLGRVFVQGSSPMLLFTSLLWLSSLSDFDRLGCKVLGFDVATRNSWYDRRTSLKKNNLGHSPSCTALGKQGMHNS